MLYAGVVYAGMQVEWIAWAGSHGMDLSETRLETSYRRT